MFNIILIFFLLAFKSGEDSQSPFFYYVSSKEVKIPIQFNCNTSPVPANKRIINDSYVVGRLFVNDGFITVLVGKIADTNYPIVYTFTKTGEAIDTLDMGGTCFSAPDGTELSYCCKIEPNKMFTIIDSTKSYKLDDVGNIILQSETIKVSVQQYRLNNDGFFVTIRQK